MEKQDTDIAAHLETTARRNDLSQDKFARPLTIMFTDMMDSPLVSQTADDFAMRQMIQQRNNVHFPIIRAHNGVLVKVTDSGMISCFENAQDCLRAAVDIQKEMDSFNLHKKSKDLFLVRIGFHTGKCRLDKNDVYGDAVEIAAYMQSAAHPGEIYLSRASFAALSDRSEVYCRLIEESALEAAKDTGGLYQAFWNEKEIEMDLPLKQPSLDGKQMSAPLKVALIFTVPLMAVLFIVWVSGVIGGAHSVEPTRSINDSVTDSAALGK